MNLTDDDIIKFQRGTPIIFNNVCAVYPAKMGEIADEGYSNFQKYLGIITAEKPSFDKPDERELKTLMEDLTDFQYILFMVLTDPGVNSTFRDAFRFFTHETDISFSTDPAQIIVGSLKDKYIINEGDFYDLQRLIRRMYFLDVDEEEIVINEDDSPATRRIKMQMRANREKLRRAKAKKARQEGSDLKFSDILGSLPLDNCGLNMVNIWDVTYYALQDQLKRLGWRDQFDMNHRAALAGAKINKSQLKHWMRSIASSDKS